MKNSITLSMIGKGNFGSYGVLGPNNNEFTQCC